jgi:dihydroorotate dehydrogenase (fumarate)
LYYLPTDPEMESSDVEHMYVRVIKDLRRQVTIPIAVKLSPFFTALPHFARRLVAAGADGLVLFNRFYQPDFDLETLSVVPHLELSTSQELRLPLRWIAILHGRIRADLALTGGVHTEYDVLKAMMAGAKVSMLASELLENGVSRLSTILVRLTRWMEDHEYESIEQMQGSMSQQSVSDPAAFERANYMKVLDSYDKEMH